MATSLAGIGAKLAPWRAPETPRQRLLVALLALVAMLALVAPYFADPLATDGPRVKVGEIDFSATGPLNRPHELAGDWEFTWLAGDDGPVPGARAILPLPAQWAGSMVGGKVLPEQGRVRYSLTVLGLPRGSYMLHVPPIVAASRVWLDGRVVAQRGVLSDSADGSTYRYRAQNVAFESDGRPLRLSLEVSAWLHRENGYSRPPVLGLTGTMDEWSALKWSRELLYNVSLLLIASVALVGFLYRPSDRASLFIGLGCLAFLPSVSVLGFDNLAIIQFPWLTFQTMLTIQYVTAGLAIVFFFASAHALFPQECPRWLAVVVAAAFGSVILAELPFLLTGDTLTASKLVGAVFMRMTVLTLILMLGCVALAALRQREGAMVFLLGMLLFVASFVAMAIVWVELLPANRVIGSEFTTLGAIMLLYSQVVLMAERWSLSVGKAEQVNDDLRQLLEVNTAITSDLQLGSLLKKIVGVTSKIIRADRSSLFLKDADSAELATLVAEGVEGGELRVDVGRGLAGYVFATGEVVNIADAYADERFNRSVDEVTGYRTRSVLTVPVTSRDGRRIGVMQALNRDDGQGFDADDAARMSAFGAQAAIAIDNARLFAEALAARSFDESILASMSGGVIALDTEWKITKINAAAAEILGASVTLLAGLDARSLLAANNPWLVDELAAVAAGAEPKLLLDVELVTARERASSVNVSITPLAGEEGRTGVLVVIEDISEEKRLQGAMRRFMTQEVVDQVLGRDDDALFGTACTASVLFADIRGFTSLAEALSPRETVETLNELFTDLYEAVSGHGGVLDKYIGDAVMAVYGAPIASARDPLNALESGLEMLAMLETVNVRRQARGASPIRIGIGIATGEVVAGTIGSPKRMDYTVIGDSVNLAARLQDLTKSYGVEMLIDQATAKAVSGVKPLREIDQIVVRGRTRPERVFEVLARDAADPAMRQVASEAYTQGRPNPTRQNWAAAIAAFEKILEIEPEDGPARILLAQARELSARPRGRKEFGVGQS